MLSDALNGTNAPVKPVSMILEPTKVDSEIALTTQRWQFDNSAVAENFVSHIEKSVPLYQEVQNLSVGLSDWFLQEDSYVYDIGCATGTTLKALYNRHQERNNVRFIGIDNSAEMLKVARKYLGECDSEKLRLFLRNIQDFEFTEAQASMIYSLYTLQFVSVGRRLDVCKKIYLALKKHGVFVMVEKIIGDNCETAEIFTHLSWERKMLLGLQAQEIYNKAQLLRGVLKPLSIEENISLLRNSGFREVSTFFQWCNWVGFIAIK